MSHEDRIRARELRRGTLRAGVHAALRDNDAVVPSHACDELELDRAVDLEGREVPGVDADDLRLERDRAVQLVGVVRLDQRLDAQLTRVRDERGGPLIVDVAQQDQHRVGAGDLGFQQIELFGEEAFGEQRCRCCRAGGLEVFEGAAEALVDEYRHCGGAGIGELRSEPRRVGIRPKIAGRG